MTYQACLDYLFSQLPIYQRIGKAAYKADLNNTIALLKIVGNPELKFKSIHLAGTNGKGSTSHMLASVMQEAGFKVGLYTSPHLKDFRERIKINGKEIPENRVIQFVQVHKESVESIQPSFFEWTVALAFDYFAEENVDIAIVETGMGGRLDSTNVLKPELSIITNIGLDHTAFLGNSLKEIAFEKAGIIKEDVPVVVGEYLEETRGVFIEKARSLNAQLIFSQDHPQKPYFTDLKGPYQKINQQTVLNAIGLLKKAHYSIPDVAVQRGMERVVANTGLHGRWETLQENPRVLIDMAHNADGIGLIMKEISTLEYQHLHIVWGMVSDKEINEILCLLPKTANYYFCQPKIPRALNVSALHNAALKAGLNGQVYASVNEAKAAALQQADEKDLIFIGGSTFVVAEVVP